MDNTKDKKMKADKIISILDFIKSIDKDYDLALQNLDKFKFIEYPYAYYYIPEQRILDNFKRLKDHVLITNNTPYKIPTIRLDRKDILYNGRYCSFDDRKNIRDKNNKSRYYNNKKIEGNYMILKKQNTDEYNLVGLISDFFY